MTKKIFNPSDWLQPQTNISSPPALLVPPEAPRFMPPKTEEPMPRFVTHETESVLPEVEQIIQKLEANQTDITSTYSDWRNIGFAFADAFGENGRALFHRVSRFHHGYSTLTATPSSPTASNLPATVSRSKPFSISPNKRV